MNRVYVSLLLFILGSVWLVYAIQPTKYAFVGVYGLYNSSSSSVHEVSGFNSQQACSNYARALLNYSKKVSRDYKGRMEWVQTYCVNLTTGEYVSVW
jgi:hypothetical protein